MNPHDRQEDTPSAPEHQDAEISKKDADNIYPTATRGIGADIPQSDLSTTPRRDVTKTGLAQEAIAAYIGGILGMGAIGLFFGVLLGRIPVAVDGSLEILTSSLYVPLFLLVFAPIAIGTGNYLYLLYPFVATSAAVGIAQNDFVLWAANSVPSKMTDSYAFALASTIAYMSLYAFYKPLWVFWKMFRTRPPSFKITAGVYGVLFLAMLGLSSLLFGHAGASLYADQQRERAAVRLPVTKQFAGLPEVVQQGSELQSYRIYHSVDGKQTGDSEDVIFTPLREWWNSDVRTACQNGIVAITPRPTYVLKKTPGGMVYAQAAVKPEVSHALPEAERYYEYHNCFVVGYQRYDYVQTFKTNEAQQYDAGIVIDAITHGEQFWPACVKVDPNFTAKRIGAYCTADDITHTNELKERAMRYIDAR